MKIAVLASHNGSTLQAVIDACESGYLDSDVVVVISNNSQSGALERARKHNIPALHISSVTSPEYEDDAICNALLDHGVDCILLAGYMKKIGPVTIKTFHGRVFNTHPSLLPKYGGEAFYGSKIYEAILANGETETGVTFHHVDEGYDTGEIVTQAKFPIQPNETAEELEERTKNVEKHLIVDTIKYIEQLGRG